MPGRLHGRVGARVEVAGVGRVALALSAAAAVDRLRHAQRGAQFLTERHGGSDVGANRVEAVPGADGWRLYGEKWFCSVADADQFLVTARPRGAPEGTRGIGCFLVPRSGGGFRIRRLKDKLGTRALATGEIEFEGAVAYALGPLEEGFHAAVSVFNTSRWLNAVGSAGLMRRGVRRGSRLRRRARGVRRADRAGSRWFERTWP